MFRWVFSKTDGDGTDREAESERDRVAASLSELGDSVVKYRYEFPHPITGVPVCFYGLANCGKD